MLLYAGHVGGRVQVVLLDDPRVALRKPVLERMLRLVPPYAKGNMHTSSTEGLG